MHVSVSVYVSMGVCLSSEMKEKCVCMCSSE